MDEKIPEEEKINRRSILKTVGGTALVGGVASVASANNNGGEEVRLEKKKVEASWTELRTVLSSDLTGQLFRSLSGIYPKIRSAYKLKILFDGALLAESIRIPTEYGSLAVGMRNSEIQYAALDLERDNVPHSLRSEISGSVGWPENTNGQMVQFDSQKPTSFIRSVSTDERKKLVGQTDGMSMSADIVAKNEISTTRKSIKEHSEINNEGRYAVINQKSAYTYSANMEPKDVHSMETGFEQQSDQITTAGGCESAAACLADVLMALPHCAFGATFCTLTGVGTLACITVLIDLCAPNLVLAHVSGACYDVVNNCL
jgi:hypothetical protein